MIRFILLSVLLIPYAYSRNAKWFFNRGTVTRVVHQTKEVTNVVPSSCVVIDPDLPRCRNVRRMDIAPSVPTKILSTATPDVAGPRSYVELEPGEERASGSPPPVYWNPWAQETVTLTKIATQTLRQVNPDAVVSIVFKGCQPTSLPFSLSACTEESKNATHQLQRELHYTTD